MKLIDKDVALAEIEKLKKSHDNWSYMGKCFHKEYENLLSSINTLEVKEVNTWHLQEKEDIYNVVKDWGLYTFACVMKDGTIQKFTGNLDEDCEGHINVHIDGVNDDYNNVDDIVYWIETPMIKAQKEEEV